MTEKSFAELERDDIKRLPYMVTHPEGSEFGMQSPTFATWSEALSAQKEWNVECPGHVARKRRLPPRRS